MGTPEVTFVWASWRHVDELALRLRPADLAEVLAAGFLGARDALQQSVANSDVAIAALFDGHVAALFGVVPRGSGSALVARESGLVWALTGEPVDRYPMTFFRWSRPVLEQLLQHCGHLVQWIDARYTSALRWAQHLGFHVDEPRPHGPSGLPFCFISLRRL